MPAGKNHILKLLPKNVKKLMNTVPKFGHSKWFKNVEYFIEHINKN